ncbi:hypothetical protein N1851_030967 [Merluccius polli]|uniref:Tc1-like transposase DDE domain-containing protein n=1 Tax=Merluccius polli TaxID=89951 RepID=A0AA47NR99_MERPO|nr:hypothetical protein N1851_030967 [Merluccius polli]
MGKKVDDVSSHCEDADQAAGATSSITKNDDHRPKRKTSRGPQLRTVLPSRQRVLELEAREPLHTFIYLDEAGFNLAKRRIRGRNRSGQRATIDVAGQQGGNITMCAAISENGVLTHIPRLGPYNTQHLLTFLDTLYRDIIPENERGLTGDHLNKHVVVWAMDAACDYITAESCRGWIRHSRRYFPHCIARDIRCDVDETIWPDREERLDVHE